MHTTVKEKESWSEQVSPIDQKNHKFYFTALKEDKMYICIWDPATKLLSQKKKKRMNEWQGKCLCSLSSILTWTEESFE